MAGRKIRDRVLLGVVLAASDTFSYILSSQGFCMHSLNTLKLFVVNQALKVLLRTVLEVVARVHFTRLGARNSHDVL